MGRPQRLSRYHSDAPIGIVYIAPVFHVIWKLYLVSFSDYEFTTESRVIDTVRFPLSFPPRVLHARGRCTRGGCWCIRYYFFAIFLF